MKWFKHYATSRNDEKLSLLEDKAGLEAYGFYFKILEVIAEVMDESDVCEVSYSITRWGRQLNISTKKFLYLSQCCSDVGLMSVCRASDSVLIKTPNLLKYRDNHTKNLQVTCKQEKEKEKEKEKETKLTSTKSTSITFNQFLARCEEKKEKRIPEDDEVFSYADKVGIPVEMIRVCWNQFAKSYSGKQKKYVDWRRTFRNCVEGNWYKLWFVEADGTVKETSQYRALKKGIDNV